MSELEQLPADQQAVVSLLVRQGRTYAQVAALLGVEDATIRRRARLAVDGLGGSAPSELDVDTAGRVVDYLLGQQDDSDRIETLALLCDSAATRAWARAIAGALAPVASVVLPSVPEEPEPSVAEALSSSPPDGRARRRARHPLDDAVDEPPNDAADGDERRTPRRDVNRGGGVLLIAGVLAIAAIVVYIVAPGSSSTLARGPIPNSAATDTTVTSTSTSSSTSTSTSTSTSSDVVAEVTLKPAAGGQATGEAEVIKDGSGDELAFSAAHLAAPGRAHYVLLLYNSSKKYEALGEIPSVSASGSVGPLGVKLPSDASSYRGIVLTLDPTDSATSKISVVLRGTSSSGF